MDISELIGKRVVVWGAGREGLATRDYLRRKLPDLPVTVIDEARSGLPKEALANCVLIHPAEIDAALGAADVIIKSPGVSLLHPLLVRQRARGVRVTSLLNLWFGNERNNSTIIAVTGTKGKSTTSSLLAHTLLKLGKRAVLLGNIGRPVTEVETHNVDYVVLEVSSFQAADFTGHSDIGIITSLFPEHLDWHGSIQAYYEAKSNLLIRSRLRFVEAGALSSLRAMAMEIDGALPFSSADLRFHQVAQPPARDEGLSALRNSFLSRAHNQSNVSGALKILEALGIEQPAALSAMESYQGLPHRQEELGEIDGVLFVDDSISTIPQSTLAASEAYPGRPQTIIVGGFDRGVDHTPLVELAMSEPTISFVCLGQSGERLFGDLNVLRSSQVSLASGMREAVSLAKSKTPRGGVVLLSPAASSFGMFRDYIDRAESFRRECGF